MKSVMEHSFSQVPRADIQRSSFDRSHGHKTTFDADQLVPIFVDEVLPGDTFKLNASFLARMSSPTITPVLDNSFLDTFFFYVPYRLLWDNWERFCGAQDNPGDSIDYTIPVVSGPLGVNVGSLGDYLGLPVGYTANDIAPSALPFRAINLIWNEWFRDQNLQDSITVNTDNGPDSAADTGYSDPPFKRGKRHDYFTSSLPWPQKGTAVDLPLGQSAPIYNTSGTGGFVQVQDGADSANMRVVIASTTNATLGASTSGNATELLRADLSSATSATINDLRLAFQTQRLLERDARSGTRYAEGVLAHFGVTIPDYRVQRPEYLGGGSSPISINPVAQTTYEATATVENAKGALSGIGQVSGTHGFDKSFVEHGIIIGFANVRSDQTYSQGLERFWSRQTRYDFFYPVLANIGEQSVLNKEIIFLTDGQNEDVFGYQERYAEYRYKPSRISGLMRPGVPGALDTFHLSEQFLTRPALGDTFITANATQGIDRAISVPSEPQYIADFYFDLRCARPMPMYGVPGNLDRF